MGKNEKTNKNMVTMFCWKQMTGLRTTTVKSAGASVIHTHPNDKLTAQAERNWNPPKRLNTLSSHKSPSDTEMRIFSAPKTTRPNYMK